MSREWKVGDFYQVSDFVGLVGDITPDEIQARSSRVEPLFVGNLALGDPEYLTNLLKLEPSS